MSVQPVTGSAFDIQAEPASGCQCPSGALPLPERLDAVPPSAPGTA